MNETRIRLQDQPLQILVLLLEHAGELVTREQIQKRLWASDTFVDFNTAINSAMRKLRESPRYLLRGNRERLWWFQFAA